MVATSQVRYIVLPRVHSATKSSRKKLGKQTAGVAVRRQPTHREFRNASESSSESSSDAGSSLSFSLGDERSFDVYSVRSLGSVGSVGSARSF